MIMLLGSAKDSGHHGTSGGFAAVQTEKRDGRSEIPQRLLHPKGPGVANKYCKVFVSRKQLNSSKIASLPLN